MNPPEPEDRGRAADAATFEEIVSDWVSEGTVPRWPGEGGPGEATSGDATAAPERPSAARTAPPEVDVPAIQLPGEFIPPDPPPMPRLGVTASIGLALLGFGIVMLVVPGILGRSSALGLPLGLVSLALGLGWFVLRSWPSATEDDDDGAVL